jgi:UDP-N-acetylglucosamine:LPS N-acetylglucosamine transferase
VQPASKNLRVLIVSATVGAGDVGNANELARRLSAQGHHARVVDFLEAAPLRVGRVLAKGYEAELRHAPWAYEALFGLWYWMPFLLRPVSRVLSAFTRRKLARWVEDLSADVVVSTYSVATQALGDMRRRAKRPWLRRRSSLRVPLVNVVTDFGYHPFWAHRCADLSLAVNPATAAAIAKRTRRPALACSPLVAPSFAGASRRRWPERRRLGLAQGDVAVLVSSGSWGVGAVRETVEAVGKAPGLVPIVACGHNETLREQLAELAYERGYRALPVGWTDDMAGLMAACDVLVENAGGLTCFEAMRAGLPVVSFRPIPGHGKKSTAAMADAGVSHLAKAADDLVAQLRRLGRPGPARRAALRAAARLFQADSAAVVAQVGSCGPPALPQLRPVARFVRAAAACSTAAALAWAGLTSGIGAAAAAGVGIAHPPVRDRGVVYVGVRLGPTEVGNHAVQGGLARLHASAVIGLTTAEMVPGAVRALTLRGIGVESGGAVYDPGQSGEPSTPWAMAQSDSRSVQVLSALSGQPVAALVPDRALSAFDLVDASNFKVVLSDQALPASPSGPYPQDTLAVPKLQGGQIYLVDGRQLTPGQLALLLNEIASQETAQHLAGAPLSWLR